MIDSFSSRDSATRDAPPDVCPTPSGADHIPRAPHRSLAPHRWIARRLFKVGWVLGTSLAAAPALAVLDVGQVAPDFQIQAAVDGRSMDFSLAKALEQGPVVLYFFPASFTEGCTLEAHLFAEAIKDFQALGATVIGVSRDDLETQKRFSVAACRGQFPVGADPDHQVMRSYDTVMTLMPTYSNRTSYVISPDRRIAYEYTSLNPKQHVEKTLAAVRALKTPGSDAPPASPRAAAGGDTRQQ